MWRNSNGAIYLEPGEIQVLAGAVGRAVPGGEVTHPSALLLRAIAAALSEFVEGTGAVIAPAPAAAVRLAAETYLLPGTAPKKARRLRLA